MRRIVSTLVAVFLFSVLISGCGGKAGAPKDGAGKTEEGLKGTITVAGSTSVQPFSEVLAEAFMAENPKARVNVQGGGSSQGIEAARSGAAEIGASSRDLKPEEKEGMREFVIAKDGIVVVVNPANKVNELSVAQVRDIFLGKITNWKQVGGEDAPITLVTREAGSGTRDGFENLVMNKEPISDKALVANSTGAVRTTVAGDRNAIGYMSMASIDSGVKALAVDGVKPDRETVKSGQYKISRPFIYVTKGEPTGLAEAFIEFVLSEEGQKIIEREGAVAVK
ncbi:MAG TPA: phosphate ABC transporter substrate-binding protein [Syntrophothermus lipocalidus]|uniref:Phosphate-binding protein n=1 Tax=Syntrophothermus lipocalidus (strain DSM 12680 / TGB-C1) TaxID=643648 RepID=D7CK35_SYNLT|nr:phosphate ABC transporter substrate-binding protein [Syntrophothermus lipocalidus]ADI01149.1 phosphate binding protein [Syntrophothermus lipocalidus DSM 12680]HHV77925.1 phosphate ABC transporter substrate-binding protein [Syntrophothermus lipocalidus]HOV42761.1 phosphate ABC transporter substrate-binding protein [Syntrophothermus lipocalidus]